MTTTDAADRPADELMAQVALRLNCAALLAWQHAEAAGSSSPLHDLGLGIYLTRGTAAQLLTSERQADDLASIDAPEHLDERSVLELLTDAESLVSSRTDLIFSALAVELCDLIREARVLGC